MSPCVSSGMGNTAHHLCFLFVFVFVFCEVGSTSFYVSSGMGNTAHHFTFLGQ